MNLYHIKMDGEEMPDLFTYEELEDLGVFDYDDIYIRKTTENSWHSAKNIKLSGKSSSNYEIDAFGQIVKKEKSSPKYTIDEYGQIVRPKDQNRSSSKQTSSSTYSSSTSRPSTSYSGSSFDWDDLWELIKMIFRFLIPIAIISISIASC